MVAVLKCRVSINGEMREGEESEVEHGEEEDGCRSAPSDNVVFAGVGVGGGGLQRVGT